MKAAAYRVLSTNKAVGSMMPTYMEDDALEKSEHFRSMRHVLVGDKRAETGTGTADGEDEESGYKYTFSYTKQSAEDPSSGFTKHELKRMEKVRCLPAAAARLSSSPAWRPGQSTLPQLEAGPALGLRADRSCCGP